MPRLELKGIHKEFPGAKALTDVSFDLEPGEIHALCGENGAGKSTLIRILCGLHPHGSFTGGMFRDGVPLAFRSIRDAEANGIGLIAQELALVPGLSVAENLLLGREPVLHGLIDWPRHGAEARRALDLVGLRVDPDTPIRELGVGSRQMVEIARALSRNSEILVLDEPTSALAPADADRLLDLLRQLRGRGVSCIYISHRIEELFRIADRMTILRDGRTVATARTGDLTPARVIALMVGREVGGLYPRPAPPGAAVLLSVRDWSVADADNPDRYVVRDVSFDLHAGEVLGLAGLMGSGRTALLSSLFGVARSRVGGTLVQGGATSGAFRSPGEAISAGIGLVSEDRQRFGLVPAGSVMDNLGLVSLGRYVRHGLLDDAACRRDCAAQVERLRIRTAGLGAPVAGLSGGNQQKVVLGKWLMVAPRVLLLDEPTRGIDVGAKAEIYHLIRQLAEDGLGILLVSSELPELLGLSHRVLVLHQGRMTARLDGEAATPERVMAAAALPA